MFSFLLSMHNQVDSKLFLVVTNTQSINRDLLRNSWEPRNRKCLLFLIQIPSTFTYLYQKQRCYYCHQNVSHNSQKYCWENFKSVYLRYKCHISNFLKTWVKCKTLIGDLITSSVFLLPEQAHRFLYTWFLTNVSLVVWTPLWIVAYFKGE